ncbi:MAG: FG-GAP repeat domain-containing protein, partial [Gemmata sp.]
GDMNADGTADIAVGTDLGNLPHVKVLNGRGQGELASFYAYAPGFLGGVRVGMGDLNGDGYADLVTGAGYGAGPHVAMFDGKSIAQGRGPRKAAGDFYVFAPSMTSGLNIAVGDVDGDGYADIVAAPGTGAAHLKVVSGKSLTSGQGAAELLSTIGWAGNTAGLRVAAVDADGDGRVDVMTSTGGPNGGRVGLFASRALAPRSPDRVRWFDPLPGLTTAVYVG